MQKITSSVELKVAIQLLEDEQALKGQLLKEKFNTAIESFKPAILLKSSIEEIFPPHFLINNIIGTTTGLVTGYLSRKNPPKS